MGFHYILNPPRRLFQTCINHKIFVRNNFLYQINKIDSHNCSFCSTNEESIERLFWKCFKTQRFLKEVAETFQEMTISLNLNERNFILANLPPTLQIHLIFNACCKILHQYVQRNPQTLDIFGI